MRATRWGIGAALALACCACRAPDGGSLRSAGEAARALERIGTSSEGRELVAVTLGSGPWRVYWIGAIHGDEPEAGRELDVLLALCAEPGVRARYRVRVLFDANPDGTAAATRGNARGVDLNRNFPAWNFEPGPRRGAAPLSEPEAAALWGDLEAFGPHLVVALHSARTGPFVNFDGPAQEWARRFAEAARAVDPRWRVEPDMGYATPGSLGTALGVDRGLPLLTLEFGRGDDPAAVRAALAAGAAALLRAAPPMPHAAPRE